MKITAIFGAIPTNDYGLTKVFDIVKSTMHEIGEEINLINLTEANLPYHHGGAPVPVLTSIVNSINESDGIIFLTTSNLFAPSGIMQTFLEYLSMPVYKNTLKGKNCMTIAIGHSQNVGTTMNYFSTVITYLGGYSSVNIPLNTSTTKNIDEPTKILLEKYTEDFYRYVKQGRKFFTSLDIPVTGKSSGQVSPAGGVFSKPTPVSEQLTPPKPTMTTTTTTSTSTPIIDQKTIINNSNNNNQSFRKANIANAYNSNIMDSFHQAQEDDISQITSLLSKKLNNKAASAKKDDILLNTSNYNVENNINTYIEPTSTMAITSPVSAPQDFVNNTNNVFNNFDEPQPVIIPRGLSCKQLTQNLTHYYQPHLADGLVANISLNISGNENFEGYIQINGNSCNYYDGAISTPDVTILSSDDTWKQILKGVLTTQRAFMTGQLKVRGNFVLLSKFDVIFKR